jgi:hypothetical protein
MKTMGGGCLGGLIGAFLGIVIGGFIGSVSYGNPHPVEVRGGAQDWREGTRELGAGLAAGAFDVCGAFVTMVLGAGIGGIIGGVGGSVLGAGMAAKASRTRTEEPPSVKASRLANGSEPPTESPDAELARLKERVTELEAEKRRNDRFKEK